MNINVLSLFDGIGTGKLALDMAGIPVDKYYSYEINKQANLVSQKNHSTIIQCGSVVDADFTKYKNIDLMIGGSPCQDLSFAGKQEGLKGNQSKLFFEYVRALEECSPKYFLLENVLMKKEYEDIISSYLGVKPTMINSDLVSAQTRKRLYWTNIPNIQQPQDKNIKLQDILESNTWEDGRKLNKATILGRRLDSNGTRKDYDKNIPITQCLEVRASNVDKSGCLTTVQKDNTLTPLGIGLYPNVYERKLPYRNYTLKEYLRLQTLPDDYMDGLNIGESTCKKMIGNGWTADVIKHIFSYIK